MPPRAKPDALKRLSDLLADLVDGALDILAPAPPPVPIPVRARKR